MFTCEMFIVWLCLKLTGLRQQAIKLFVLTAQSAVNTSVKEH